MKKKLLLLLDNYPYTVGEYSFIKTELGYLLQKYEVAILSTSPQIKQDMPLDSRIGLWHCIYKFGMAEKIKTIVRFLFSKYGQKEIMDIMKSQNKVLGRIYDAISFYGCAKSVKRYVEENKILKQDEEIIVYSYWFNAACMGFMLGKEKYPLMRIVSRIHGYDLYNERNTYGRQPFRFYMDQQVDKLFFVAESGKEYYQKNWYNGDKRDKYQVAFIGTENLKSEPIKTEKDNNKFLMISCSNLIPLKRVELIIRALALVEEMNIEWIHFGVGIMREQLEEDAKTLLAEKDNIHYCFKGFVDNESILSYYDTHYVDCFITTSSTEGCPVSIQEAMSYEIPIIATAVGEIPNMIQGNGVLLSEDPEADEIKDAIEALGNSKDIKQMRKNSRKLWEKKYDAHKNAQHFLQELERVFE